MAGRSAAPRLFHRAAAQQVADDQPPAQTPSTRKRTKGKTKSLHDIATISEWERIFSARKRTIMLKAVELEESTGSTVAVIVKSPTGDTYYYASNEITSRALKNGSLINERAIAASKSSLTCSLAQITNPAVRHTQPVAGRATSRVVLNQAKTTNRPVEMNRVAPILREMRESCNARPCSNPDTSCPALTDTVQQKSAPRSDDTSRRPTATKISNLDINLTVDSVQAPPIVTVLDSSSDSSSSDSSDSESSDSSSDSDSGGEETPLPPVSPPVRSAARCILEHGGSPTLPSAFAKPAGITARAAVTQTECNRPSNAESVAHRGKVPSSTVYVGSTSKPASVAALSDGASCAKGQLGVAPCNLSRLNVPDPQAQLSREDNSNSENESEFHVNRFRRAKSMPPRTRRTPRQSEQPTNGEKSRNTDSNRWISGKPPGSAEAKSSNWKSSTLGSDHKRPKVPRSAPTSGNDSCGMVLDSEPQAPGTANRFSNAPSETGTAPQIASRSRSVADDSDGKRQRGSSERLAPFVPIQAALRSILPTPVKHVKRSLFENFAEGARTAVTTIVSPIGDVVVKPERNAAYEFLPNYADRQARKRRADSACRSPLLKLPKTSTSTAAGNQSSAKNTVIKLECCPDGQANSGSMTHTSDAFSSGSSVSNTAIKSKGSASAKKRIQDQKKVKQMAKRSTTGTQSSSAGSTKSASRSDRSTLSDRSNKDAVTSIRKSGQGKGASVAKSKQPKMNNQSSHYGSTQTPSNRKTTQKRNAPPSPKAGKVKVEPQIAAYPPDLLSKRCREYFERMFSMNSLRSDPSLNKYVNSNERRDGCSVLQILNQLACFKRLSNELCFNLKCSSGNDIKTFVANSLKSSQTLLVQKKGKNGFFIRRRRTIVRPNLAISDVKSRSTEST